ncbi:MAG: Hcp family type VI secretion system effector [Caulobacterales bacterium]
MNVRLGLTVLAAATALAAIPAKTLAAVDSFIWFDGVEGDSKDPSHKGSFEIKDFSLAVEHPTTTVGSATGGAGAGKAKFQEFTIKRLTDRASPDFFKRAAASGQHFTQVRLELRKAGHGESKPFMEYRFTNVFVTKIDWSGPGDEGPEESITFVYGALAVKYNNQGADQSTTRAPASAAAPTGKTSPWGSAPGHW